MVLLSSRGISTPSLPGPPLDQSAALIGATHRFRQGEVFGQSSLLLAGHLVQQKVKHGKNSVDVWIWRGCLRRCLVSFGRLKMRKFEVSLSLFASTESIFTTIEVQAEDESMAEIAALQALVIEVKGIEEVAAER